MGQSSSHCKKMSENYVLCSVAMLTKVKEDMRGPLLGRRGPNGVSQCKVPEVADNLKADTFLTLAIEV